MVILFFPFSLVDRFLHLWFFMAPVVSTDYPFLDVKWPPRSFGLLPFRWDLVTDYAVGLSIRGGNLTTRTTLMSVPRWLFIKCRHLQRPKLGAFEPLVSSCLPGHPRPEWLPGGVAFVWMRTVAWASIALHIQPILAAAFDCTSMGGFSSRIACICCPFCIYRQPFERRPCGLRPTPCV